MGWCGLGWGSSVCDLVVWDGVVWFKMGFVGVGWLVRFRMGFVGVGWGLSV